MPRRLKGKMLNNQRLSTQMYFLTVNDRPHILGETVNNLKRLHRRRPSLILGQSIQPLKYGLDPILSKELLYEFLCMALSKGNTSFKTDSLGRPCLICFVASARVESSSTNIFTTISVIASVGGTLV